jgi:hypothetical protein
MGFRAALQYGVEACSILDATETPEGRHFEELRQTQGLKDALKWRKELFSPFE